MTLYNKVKHLLPETKSAISDSENLLLNRKDYHLSQISPVNALVSLIGVKISYPYRVLLSFLDQVSSGLVKDDFNIVISDPSIAVAGFYCWVRSGGGAGVGRVYAPKGIGTFRTTSSLITELAEDFAQHTQTSTNSRPPENRQALFTFVLGNTKTSIQTIFAADRYFEAKSGILILKDYARVDAYDERDYLEGKGILPGITFEGHGFAIKGY